MKKNQTIMNKAELIDAIAENANLSKVAAKGALDAFTDVVAKTLKKGDKVALVGFGTFSVSERTARTGRNPRTGAAIQIKAKKVAKFKAGSELSF
ncbi:MAG: HU family DNA-binding protein [Bacteroidales bacterium]